MPNLAHGRPYLAIPGPSTIPERVLQAMNRGAPNIYAGALHDMVAGLWPDLKALAGTTGDVAVYIGNGHALWEAANTNLFSRGEKALVLASGLFGHGWANSARGLGVEVALLDFGPAPMDLDRVEDALRADRTREIRAVLMTQTDTASSVKNDVAAVRSVLDALGHPALLAVDCIATLGCDEYRMDDWGVDLTIAASQKGLMTPPGIGFLWMSPRAMAASESAGLRTPYWAVGPRARPTEFWQYFCGTAPTHHLFGLRAALDMIGEEGLPNVWARHHHLARAVWAAVEAWGRGNPEIRLNVADPACRGWSVTSVRMGAPHATRLRDWTETQAGVTLGIGLGMSEPGDPHGDGFLRIAHMGHVNAHMTLGALAVAEAGMQALDIPHGTGALEAAAAVIAS
ncbi:aminotransferase class V-fold PLP-dependent enzyme [Tabrizicola sp. J26]|uniref:pyridoxal-phosphate-dependent aminotransferase family protein n=1 Tax=Alitabrizicola rongguiensis TaxID=2909234 RepID=UPI001F2E8F1B|nr:aminotransferase class V-fold PLP-dependent enzyme [Tabrizicola rongguiensis]MCF1710933.1 aminotransferase class V-fold PLP-dependent enzyme [Tabrizicola rongguiensis]